ncbi:MAG TPA: hypothetical protein VEJ41_07515 [Candidatus Acidoferrales bacterium]|nr:hypothetical protein [Candidatus Acidoferrales bacterium]
MIAAIVLAAVTAAASPAPAPANTYKPLREVVYNVVANLQINQTSESYGGYNSSDTPGISDTNAAAPSSTQSTGRTGVVTVDVMAVASDGTLGVQVTETWQGLARPLVYDGAVAPDGTVEFPNSTINDATRELLSYFGTKFAPSDGLAQDTTWHTIQPFMNGNVETDYTVTAVNGGVVTISKKQTIKDYDIFTSGTIQYEATTLVPISGRITKRMSSSLNDTGTEFDASSSTSRDRTLTLRFDRVSDTHPAPTNQ